MSRTLTICSWSLVALGILMTGYFFLPRPANSVVQNIVAFWVYAPYIVSFFPILAARSCAARAIVLGAVLFNVCYGFWFYFDLAFVHLTTMSDVPLTVPFVQSAVAAAAWVFVRYGINWTNR